jgi:preprotein translocase subunit SecG
MIAIVTFIHILVCLLLIVLVLSQDPKNSGVGSMFGGGGGSNTLFGATGATTFLTKLTRYSAIVFAICCLLLVSRPKTSSVMDAAGAAAPGSLPPVSAPAEAPGSTAPAAPAAPSGQPAQAPATPGKN